jgi:hypothetical protein
MARALVWTPSIASTTRHQGRECHEKFGTRVNELEGRLEYSLKRYGLSPHNPLEVLMTF